jgi:hypothetical protein
MDNNTKENLNAYTKILKEKLGNEGVSVNEDTLAKTLVDAQKQMAKDCDSCVAGWHW